jgi:methionyl-tRNA formyltransferase
MIKMNKGEGTMRIVFMGTPDFAVPALETLINERYHVVGVVTQPDRPKGRKKTLAPTPVKEAALKHGIPVLQPEKLKHSSELEQLKEWAPDLIVTAAFGQLLPKEVLELPELGCINVHASLLPKYRGGAPIHQAIIDGENETGVTIMYMVQALDAGDILTQVKAPIEEQDDVASMFEKLSLSGAQLLKETLPLLQEGKLEPIPQNEGQVIYAPNIKREDEEIDWQKDGKAIYNHIRGLHPFPGSFTTVFGGVLKVWKSKKTSDQGLVQEPGTIYRLDQEGIGVTTGDGTGLLLTTIQPAGKKRMEASDFIRGAGSDWSVGMKLGVAK